MDEMVYNKSPPASDCEDFELMLFWRYVGGMETTTISFLGLSTKEFSAGCDKWTNKKLRIYGCLRISRLHLTSDLSIPPSLGLSGLD